MSALLDVGLVRVMPYAYLRGRRPGRLALPRQYVKSRRPTDDKDPALVEH